MKILVTGASGRLGPFVVADLTAAGHELVLFCRGQPEGAARWPWVQGSIVNPADVARVFERGPFDAVQHLAAQPWPTDRPRNVKQAREQGLPPEWTLQANVMGTYHMLRGAVENRVPVFVMTSSNCALGHGYRISGRPFPFRYLPVDEAHPSDVEDSYSFSKLVDEQMMLQHTRAFGIRTYGVRASGICAPAQRERLAAQTGPAAEWSDFLWSWVGSEDVALAHRLLMEHAGDLPPHGVYFCTADDTSIVEPTHEYLARFRPDLLPLAADLRGHAGFFATHALRQAVGWRPTTAWRTGGSAHG